MVGLARALRRANLALACVFIGMFVGVAIARTRYPFALEWTEGGILDEVRWLLAGHNPYCRPSVDFVPFIYNPLYFWVSAGFAKVLGAKLVTLRLVSVAASLGTMGIVYALVFEETKSRFAGVVAAGLFAATFDVTSRFMDLARVDSLFALTVVAALWAVRTRQTRAGRLWGAFFLVLAFLAKQPGLLIALVMAAAVLRDEARGATTMRERLRGLPFAALVVVGIGSVVLLLQLTSDGWYAFYAFDVPSAHHVAPQWIFWTSDLLGNFALGCAGVMFALVVPSSFPRRAREVWGATLAAVLLTSWTGRMHSGGWANVLIPLFAVLAPLAVIGFHHAASLADGFAPSESTPGRLPAFVALLGLLQFAQLAYNPLSQVPSKTNEAAGWRLVAALRDAPGDVLIPQDSYLAAMAGKRSYMHKEPVDDVMRATQDEDREQLKREIGSSLSHARWAMVVADDQWSTNLMRAGYERDGEPVTDPAVFFPVSGWRERQLWIYRPKQASGTKPASDDGTSKETGP